DQYAATNKTCPEVPIPSRSTLMGLALAEACRRAAATDIATSTPPKAEITLVVKASDPTQAKTSDGVRVQDGTTRVLECDADWFPVVVDSLGQPLDMGRRIRFAT